MHLLDGMIFWNRRNERETFQIESLPSTIIVYIMFLTWLERWVLFVITVAALQKGTSNHIPIWSSLHQSLVSTLPTFCSTRIIWIPMAFQSFWGISSLIQLSDSILNHLKMCILVSWIRLKSGKNKLRTNCWVIPHCVLVCQIRTWLMPCDPTTSDYSVWTPNHHLTVTIYSLQNDIGQTLQCIRQFCIAAQEWQHEQIILSCLNLVDQECN